MLKICWQKSSSNYTRSSSTSISHVKAAAISSLAFEVKVRSQETIKPSSPTPPHLRTFRLSLLDLFLPREYPSFIYFFRPPPPRRGQHEVVVSTRHGERVSMLRDSLSKSLSRFYTFAGRINGDDDATTVDCNDQGVLFTEAEVNVQLRDLLSSPHPKLELLDHLAAVPMYYPGHHLAAVRVNLFQCGGVALSIAVNHRVADACTVDMWVKDWAALALGNIKSDHHHHHHRVAIISNVGAALFPVSQAVLDRASSSWRGALFSSQGVCSTKRFVFDPAAISSLQQQITGGGSSSCSRTQAILALVWKCASRSSSSAGSGSSVAFSYVNLRPRFNNPPLPEYAVGNLLLNAVARYLDHEHDDHDDGDEDGRELACRADLLGRSAREIDGELLEKLTGADEHREIAKWQEKVNEKRSFRGRALRHYNFTSVIGMGLNEVDFGWGRPIWIGSIAHTDGALKNCVSLVKPTAGSEAIDAWVTLAQDEMAVFERDAELLQYAAINPGFHDFNFSQK